MNDTVHHQCEQRTLRLRPLTPELLDSLRAQLDEQRAAREHARALLYGRPVAKPTPAPVRYRLKPGALRALTGALDARRARAN